MYAEGWINDQPAVWETVRAMEAGGVPHLFADAAPGLLKGDDNAPIFFWKAEEKVLGGRKPSWNQKQVGACVGFGNGRTAQDLMLWEIAAGEPETWPGAEVSPEVIYGGSRVEVGGGRISGDGSVGAWAAKWVKEWGVVVRGVYGSLDLTTYDEATCRKLGSQGIPTDVETLAKVHPVTAVAMVRNGDEFWAAVGGGKPVAVCSDRGFTTTLKRGFCSPSGTWNHCMEGRGRFTHPSKGKCGVIQNSWNAYLSIPAAEDRFIEYVDIDGSVKTEELPEGCFATTLDVIDGMMRQQDSFAMAGFKGWESVRFSWYI